MNKNILLVCAGGFSTSMLVERMKEAANKKGLEVTINACGEGALDNYLPTDIVMLGPQMGHQEDSIKEKVGSDIPVTVIDMMDYGMMDGEKVLSTALNKLEA